MVFKQDLTVCRKQMTAIQSIRNSTDKRCYMQVQHYIPIALQCKTDIVGNNFRPPWNNV